MPTPEYTSRIQNETDLDVLLGESVEHNAAMAAAEANKKLVNDRIRDLMVGAGMVKGLAYVRTDGVGATLQTRVTKTVNATKLIAKGVDPAVVNDCTDVNESAMFVTVRVPKAKGEKD